MRAIFAAISGKMDRRTQSTPAVLVAPLIRGLTTDKEWLHE